MQTTLNIMHFLNPQVILCSSAHRKTLIKLLLWISSLHYDMFDKLQSYLIRKINSAVWIHYFCKFNRVKQKKLLQKVKSQSIHHFWAQKSNVLICTSCTPQNILKGQDNKHTNMYSDSVTVKILTKKFNEASLNIALVQSFQQNYQQPLTINQASMCIQKRQGQYQAFAPMLSSFGLVVADLFR